MSLKWSKDISKAVKFDQALATSGKFIFFLYRHTNIRRSYFNLRIRNRERISLDEVLFDGDFASFKKAIERAEDFNKLLSSKIGKLRYK